MIPDGGTDAETLVVVFVVVQVVIAPESFHPFKRRIPGMDRVVHATVHQVTQDKTREKDKSILRHQQEHEAENDR